MISVITLMGVSGCGKTTIGSALAEKLDWQFIESDDYTILKGIFARCPAVSTWRIKTAGNGWKD